MFQSSEGISSAENEEGRSVDQKPEAEQEKSADSRVVESQEQMKGIIKELSGVSRYERERVSDNQEVITSPEGERYKIRVLTDPQDPAVEKMHKMLLAQFGENETEPLDWIREAIEGGDVSYLVIETPDGRITTTLVGQSLDLEPVAGREGEPTESMLAVFYALTDAEFQKRGLAREAYQSLYEETLRTAEKEGSVVKGIIGEAVTPVEPFLNRLGRERLYYEDGEGNIREVPYKYPPMEFDEKTGKPVGESGYDHLMLRMVDGSEEVPVSELTRMVNAIYESYVGEEDDYNSKKAFNRATQTTEEILQELQDVLEDSKDGKVFMMSETERQLRRQELESRGKELEDVVAESDKAESEISQ